MLRTQLLDLIDSGTAWAFVGSGPSTESGYPSWPHLVDEVRTQATDAAADLLARDARLEKALERRNFPSALARLEAAMGRDALEHAVTIALSTTKQPGALTKLIADMPFQGYITTNYDTLLETALAKLGGGWVPVGNTPSELPKVASGAERIVWHIHGLMVPDPPSTLVLTERDYDAVYLNGSPLLRQMRSLAQTRRLVFIGFGFQDPEVLRLLRAVGLLANPARPAYAFLPEDVATESKRDELLERYNIDTIPYNAGTDHTQLRSLLQTYAALTVTRSIKFGAEESRIPREHDPETTGLLIYNKLCLSGAAVASDDTAGLLVQSLTLAVLGARGTQTTDQLSEALAARARLLQPSDADPQWIPSVLADALKQMEVGGLVALRHDDGGSLSVVLLEAGDALLREQASHAELLEDQFHASLEERLIPEQAVLGEDGIARVATVASTFLKESIDKRALGVAMAFRAPRPEVRNFQVAALLRTLPSFMPQLASTEEGHALVSLIKDVFTGFGKAESRYLGVALQAKFGAHLLGMDPDALRARLAEIQQTVFLIDASTLIPLLARHSPGHGPANLLLDRISSVGAVAATTDLLAEEVAEHARWALDRAGTSGRLDDVGLFKAYLGKAGYRANAFIEGAVAQMDTGRGGGSLADYLTEVLGPRGTRNRYTREHVAVKLDSLGIICTAFSGWEGYKEELLQERDMLKQRIAMARGKSYKHARQVQAEAEAALVVRELRLGGLRIPGTDIREAFFVSQTRAIDVGVPGQVTTMRLDSALQWLATLVPMGPQEIESLSNVLLWELSLTGHDLVDIDRAAITFGPYVDASKERLLEEVERQSVLIGEVYGESAVGDFESVEAVDAPLVLHSLLVQSQEVLTARLQRSEEQKALMATNSAMNEAERDELERLRAEKRQRKQRQKARERSKASSPGSRKRGKTKKKRKKKKRK